MALVAALAACQPAPPPVLEDSTGRWEERARLPRGPRQETAVVALRGEVVVIGGVDDQGATLAVVEAYDPAVDRWRRLADLPVPLHHANGAVVRDTLVVAGFLVGAAFTPDGRVFRYDADADSWSQGASMPAGTERGASGCAAVGDAVYVVGGLHTGSVPTVSRYDVVGDVWEALPDLPTGLDHLGAFAVGERLAIVGGRTNGVGRHSAAVLVLDTRSLEVTAGAPMPTSRAGFAGAVVGGEVVIVGGEGGGASNGVFPQVEAYDLDTNAWRALIDMRTPRHGMGAATIDGALYVPGGADREGFAAVDVHDRLVPRPRPTP